MNVSITREEFQAISFAIGQIESALETSENMEYNKEADQSIKCLQNILNKYRTSRTKADELNESRRFVRSRNPWMSQVELDKMARAVLRKSKELAND